jgi:hypothetical protein
MRRRHLWQDPVSCKFVVDKNCLQVKKFTNFSFEFSYENENGIQQRLQKFAQISWFLNSTFKSILVRNFSRMKVYNSLVLPILLYRKEIWNLRKKEQIAIDIKQYQVLQKNTRYIILPPNELRNFGRFVSRTSFRKK